jgi:soluble lytic murein transglycosylase-like protein
MYSKVILKYPDINRTYAESKSVNYSQPNIIKGNTALLKSIFLENKNAIKKWGSIFEVDKSIIASFIITESGGKDLAPRGSAQITGIMQVSTDTVWEILAKWKSMTGSDLPLEAKAYFDKVLPESKNFNPNVLPNSALKSKIANLLYKNREFSIAIGTANIRWLLEAYSNGTTSPINKVMIGYNAGYYGTKSIMKGSPTTEKLATNLSLPKESRSYLLKILGTKGFLTLFFDNKLDQL